MPLKCFNCSNPFNLNKVPFETKFGNKWLKVIPNAKSKYFDDEFRLCSLHFEQKYLTKNAELLENAIPSIFLMENGVWQEVNEEDCTVSVTELGCDNPSALDGQPDIAFEYVGIKQELAGCGEEPPAGPSMSVSNINNTDTLGPGFSEIKMEPEDNSSSTCFLTPMLQRNLKRNFAETTELMPPSKHIKLLEEPSIEDQYCETEDIPQELNSMLGVLQKKNALIAKLKRENMQLTAKLRAAEKRFSKLGKISFDSLIGQHRKVRYLTGFPNFSIMEIIFNYAKNYIPWDFDLTAFDVFLLTCMKLKLNLSLTYISIIMNITAGRISKLFNSTFIVLLRRLNGYIVWPYATENRDKIPIGYNPTFGDQRFIIIDCLSNIMTRNFNTVEDCLTQKLPPHTLKYLICFSSTGRIIFLSRPMDAALSNYDLVHKCDFLDMLDTNDLLLAERSFVTKLSMPNIQTKRKIVLAVKKENGELSEINLLDIPEDFTKIRQDIVENMVSTKQRVLELINRMPCQSIDNHFGVEMKSQFCMRLACAIFNVSPTQDADEDDEKFVKRIIK